MNHTARQIAIAEGLFTWPSEDPHLIGSICRTCAAIAFPQKKSCPKCCSQDVTSTPLAQRGTLWSWTVQAFAPKSPPYASGEAEGQFAPFGIGYVELPGQVRVEARLTESDPARLHIGMPMELAIVPFSRNADGDELMSFAFRPVARPTQANKESA
ncbi:MAG: OB-fold domain-containing protein [Pseudomonadota bacterium]